MSNAMKLFQNEEFGKVRVVEVEGEYHFALKDVLEAQGSKTTTTNAITAIENGLGDGYVVGIPIKDSLGRDQEAKFVSESAVTFLVARGNTERSRRCNRWIHTEVLPSIRKTGSYSVQPQVPQTFADALRLAAQLEDEKAALAAKIEKDEPKVSRTEFVEGSDVCILVGTMAKVICQNGIDMGQNRLFSWLRDKGLLCHKGSRKNTPTQKAMDMGLFRIVEGTRKNSDGDNVPTYTSYVTGKGQTYIIDALKRERKKEEDPGQKLIIDNASAGEE